MINHLSYSQLNLFAKCQKQWQFRYLDKIPAPVKGEVLRGDAYHKALAYAYSSMVIYKEAPSIDEILSVYSDAWDKRLRDKLIIDEGEEIYLPAVDFKDKDPGKLKDEGIELLKIYYHTTLPAVIPREVEVKKTTTYEGIPLVSYIDLVTQDGTICEHKVSARNFSNTELQKDLQSLFYGLVLGGNEIDFHIHQALALKKPEIKVISIKRSKADIDWIGRMVMAVWKQIELGVFSPSPAGYWCSPDFCPYWGHCRMPEGF